MTPAAAYSPRSIGTTAARVSCASVSNGCADVAMRCHVARAGATPSWVGKSIGSWLPMGHNFRGGHTTHVDAEVAKGTLALQIVQAVAPVVSETKPTGHTPHDPSINCPVRA